MGKKIIVKLVKEMITSQHETDKFISTRYVLPEPITVDSGDVLEIHSEQIVRIKGPAVITEAGIQRVKKDEN